MSVFHEPREIPAFAWDEGIAGNLRYYVEKFDFVGVIENIAVRGPSPNIEVLRTFPQPSLANIITRNRIIDVAIHTSLWSEIDFILMSGIEISKIGIRRFAISNLSTTIKRHTYRGSVPTIEERHGEFYGSGFFGNLINRVQGDGIDSRSGVHEGALYSSQGLPVYFVGLLSVPSVETDDCQCGEGYKSGDQELPTLSHKLTKHAAAMLAYALLLCIPILFGAFIWLVYSAVGIVNKHDSIIAAKIGAALVAFFLVYPLIHAVLDLLTFGCVYARDLL